MRVDFDLVIELGEECLHDSIAVRVLLLLEFWGNLVYSGNTFIRIPLYCN